jgi:peptide deformylase
MSIRKIVRMGHPVLSRKAVPVADPSAAEVRGLIADMVETMVDANGAGLAAPQVHESVRIIIFHAPGERGGGGEDEMAPLTVLINPEIEILTDEMEEGWEGCLSIPGLRGLVPRYTRLRYRGLDAAGSPVEREAAGFHARVVQHECDHLDGILYPQRMRDLSELIFESEWRHRVPAREGETP